MVAFIAARSEQYIPALIFFAFYPFTDMIVAGKLLIVVVWTGAAFSKFGRHFANVIPPMVSNTPWLPLKSVKRLHYRNFPEDLRPSERAVGLAHVGGTLVEFVVPFVLLFSHNRTVTVLAVIGHDRLPRVHHLDVPARGPARVERAVHVHRRLPVPRLPPPRAASGSRT